MWAPLVIDEQSAPDAPRETLWHVLSAADATARLAVNPGKAPTQFGQRNGRSIIVCGNSARDVPQERQRIVLHRSVACRLRRQSDIPREMSMVAPNMSPERAPLKPSRPTLRSLRTLAVLIAAVWSSTGGGKAAADYREVPIADGGSVSGAVLVAGDVPVLPPQPVFKELKFCGETRSEEHTSELQSLRHLVCRLLLEKK